MSYFWDTFFFNLFIFWAIILGIYYLLEFSDYLVERCQRKKIIPMAEQVDIESGTECNENTATPCVVFKIQPVHVIGISQIHNS